MQQNLIPTKGIDTLEATFPEMDCVSDIPTRQSHIDSAVARNLPVCGVRPLRKGKLAIVASAPSVTNYVDTLKEWDGEIWGVNGAFGWMIHRGIKPDAFIGIDPEWFLKDYLPDPPQDATYYLSSQVHPCVFDHLKDRKVHLWFQADDQVKFPIGSVTVPGGSTCLGRAPYLACLLGWQDVHIFGGDSSFTHKTHVYGGELPERFVYAEANGKTYKTLKNLLMQACDMVQVVQNFPGSITVHGEGLLQSMCAEVRDSGVMEFLEMEEKQQLGKLNRRERRMLKRTRAA